MLLPSVMSLHQKRQQRRHLRYPLQKVLVHSQRWFAFVCLLCCCAYVVVYVLLLLVFFIGMPMGQAVVQDSIYIYNKQTTMQLTAGDGRDGGQPVEDLVCYFGPIPRNEVR
eukprot:m.196650 g.196650  ORF g.196650 m.196650 type:complete len:111 (-) comp13678_c2_seq4:136-468(-)